MSLIGNPSPPLVIGTPPTLEYVSHAASGANTSVYAFYGQAIGDAAADRVVVVAVLSQNGSGTPGHAPTGVTVGGNAMTLVTQAEGTGANESAASIWQRAVSSGTTADIVVTHDNNLARCGIVVLSLTDYVSATAVATTGNAVAANTTQSLSFDISSRQIGVIAGANRSGSATCVFTNAVEVADFILESGSGSAAAGIVQPGFTGTASLTWTLSGNLAAAGAVWG